MGASADMGAGMAGGWEMLPFVVACSGPLFVEGESMMTDVAIEVLRSRVWSGSLLRLLARFRSDSRNVSRLDLVRGW